MSNCTSLPLPERSLLILATSQHGAHGFLVSQFLSPVCFPFVLDRIYRRLANGHPSVHESTNRRVRRDAREATALPSTNCSRSSGCLSRSAHSRRQIKLWRLCVISSPPLTSDIDDSRRPDMKEGGLQPDEALEQVRWLINCGMVDFIELSGGNAEGSQGSSRLASTFSRQRSFGNYVLISL